MDEFEASSKAAHEATEDAHARDIGDLHREAASKHRIAAEHARLAGKDDKVKEHENLAQMHDNAALKCEAQSHPETKGEKLTGAQIHLGAMAHGDFKNGINPPSWVTDEEKWNKAKTAANKTYSLDDDAYWPVVVSIYENMGGETKARDGSENKGEVQAARKDDGKFSSDPFDHSLEAWDAKKVADESGKKEDHEKAAHLFSKAADKLRAAGYKRHAAFHEELSAEHKAKMEACDSRKAPESFALDCASQSANQMRTAVPTADGVLMYMPAGTHAITPSQNGKAVNVTVEVNAEAADRLEEQRQSLTANGKKPFFSIQHETEIAAFWPTKFFWDKRIDATGSFVEGIWAEGEWTKSGREAVEGKDFRTFSPTFFVDAIRNDENNPCQVVCNYDARANMGALENDPAFQSISPLWARGSDDGSLLRIIRATHETLRSSDPDIASVISAMKNRHNIDVTQDQVAEALV